MLSLFHDAHVSCAAAHLARSRSARRSRDSPRAVSSRLHAPVGSTGRHLYPRSMVQGPNLRTTLRPVSRRSALALLRDGRKMAKSVERLMVGHFEGALSESPRLVPQRRLLARRRAVPRQPTVLAQWSWMPSNRARRNGLTPRGRFPSDRRARRRMSRRLLSPPTAGWLDEPRPPLRRSHRPMRRLRETRRQGVDSAQIRPCTSGKPPWQRLLLG